MPRCALCAALIAVVVARGSSGLTAERATYRVDPANSHASIHVGKAGAFSFIAGHTHDVIGPIHDGVLQIDVDDPSQSRARLTIASSELEVSAEGEPEGDAPKVQEAMESAKVLDVSRYPEIAYESHSVTVKSRRDRVLEVSITGQLTIRGVTRPVTVPMRVEIADGTLSAQGHFEVKQSEFGIKPVSVGGVVAVKDTLQVEISIVATR